LSGQESGWEEITSYNHWRKDHALVTLDGSVYAIGGWSKWDRIPLRSVEAYDPESDMWTEKSSMAKPRYGLTTSVVNGKIYAIGGRANYDALSVVEEYDPSLD